MIDSRVPALLLLVVLSALPVVAQNTPPSVKVQGFLTDKTGGTPVPANGSTNMLFQLFDAELGGGLLASVGPMAVDVVDGRYEVELPLGGSLFDAPDRFLEITVGAETLSPRIRIVSVPYALRSDVAFTAASVAPESIDSDSLAAGAVTVEKIGIVCGVGQVLMFNGAVWSCASLTTPQVCSQGDYVHCYGGPAGTADTGICREGTSSCRPDGGGFGSCDGQTLPTSEICGNGLDDDCDGGTDCGDTDCSSNPTPEVCDGIDNDCDGGTPDGTDEPWLGQPCDGPDSDSCDEGVFSCSAGSQVCNDSTGDTVEICSNGIDEDCSGTPDDGPCAPCSNGIMDGDETGLDCGGPLCGPCPNGQGCQDELDCLSGYCDPGTMLCAVAPCSNGILDAGNGETDVDCGGPNCSPCADGLSCLQNSDCISAFCNASQICELQP